MNKPDSSDTQNFNLVYHYNPFNRKWYCIPREHYTTYFNGDSSKCGSSLLSLDQAYQEYKLKTKCQEDVDLLQAIIETDIETLQGILTNNLLSPKGRDDIQKRINKRTELLDRLIS